IITLNLIINNASSSTDVQTACDTYTWIDGITYTESNNTATHTIPNAAGCDSIITLNLTINKIDSSVTSNGVELTATESGATYQWLDCPEMTPIDGATEQSYTATANGDYAVVVTVGDCSDTSACVNINTVGVSENNLINELSIYPNPTKDLFTVNFNNFDSDSRIIICTVIGNEIINQQIIDNKTIIDLKNYSKGIYFVKIKNGNNTLTKKIMKQ
ncbi:MAG: T9SS type A sorting domain-containing protein, partial [Planctomycetes bacterium]|nr:T9SS type A sorting domain-containing protein [Planctomycetota bacterium]